MKLMKKVIIPIFALVSFLAFTLKANASTVPEYISDIYGVTENGEIHNPVTDEDEFVTGVKIEFKALKEISDISIVFGTTSATASTRYGDLYSASSLEISDLDAIAQPEGNFNWGPYAINSIVVGYYTTSIEEITSPTYGFATIKITGADAYIETIVYNITSNTVESVNKEFDSELNKTMQIYNRYGYYVGIGDKDYVYFYKTISDDPEIYSEIKISKKDYEEKSLEDIYKLIEEQIKETEKEVNIYIGENEKLTSDILDIIKEEEYVATIDVAYNDDAEDEEDFRVTDSWIFDGKKIKSTNYEIDLGITIGTSENKDSIIKLVGENKKSIIIDFAHSGKLPEGTQVKLYVGDTFDDKKKLMFSYYNPTTKQLEVKATKLEVIDGYVTIDLEHCSEYVLEEDNIIEVMGNINNAQTSSLNYIVYTAISVISIAIIGISLIKLKKQA